MHYQFTSKVAMEIPKKRSTLQIVSLIAGVLSLLATLATIFICGLSEVNFLVGIFVPVFLLYNAFRKNTTIEYVPTEVTINLAANQITISYPSVKYRAGDVQSSEVYVFVSENLHQFQFSTSLCAVRFYGSPVISIDGQKQPNDGRLREKVVYLPAGEAESICRSIEQFLGIQVQQMED